MLRCRSSIPVLLTALVFVLLLSAPAAAYEPSWYVGTYAETEGYSDATTPFTSLVLNGVVNWRSFNENGYLSLYGSTEIASYLSGINGREDRHAAAVEAGTDLGPVRLTAETEGMFSLDHLTYGLFSAPSWSLQAALGEELGPFTPQLEYFGSYRYQQDYDEDRLSHGVAAELSYSSTVTRSYWLRVSGGWELWPDEHLFDSSGNETGTERRDVTAAAELSAEGLLGYFADWETALRCGLRNSNANRYVTAESSLRDDSEDRITAAYDARINWSPVRSLSLTASLYIEGDWYTDRLALNDSGEFTGSELTVYRSGGSLSADINLSDHLYAVLSASGHRMFSEDPSFSEWDFSLRGGLQYSF